MTPWLQALETPLGVCVCVCVCVYVYVYVRAWVHATVHVRMFVFTFRGYFSRQTYMVKFSISKKHIPIYPSIHLSVWKLDCFLY